VRILVTGGLGFIGSNFIRLALRERADWEITNLDKVTYAANPANLLDFEDDGRYRFVRGDIGDARLVENLLFDGTDVIVHFAAESHVDRSILDGEAFVRTNVLGTQILLDGARRRKVRRFIHISTDEVYGSLGPEGRFRENDPLRPNSPYAASKAGADHLVQAYVHTYGIPAIITRSSNNYGPYQFPEKMIPLFITNALHELSLPVYGDGQQVREWIHVLDHCEAILRIIERGRPGEIYNIGSGEEQRNVEVARAILARLGRPLSLITHVKDRPGHDRRYALAIGKIQEELDWKPMRSLPAGLDETVTWYVTHRDWWEALRSETFQQYYALQYGQKPR
jgi:dTDP-glucose 4,6-dehydratase